MSSKRGKNDDGSTSSKNSDSSDSEDESTGDVVLSLKDPTYNHIMHQYFIKLGTKANPNNPEYTDAVAAKEVYDIFKKKDGKFLKYRNPRCARSGYVKVNDDDALESKFYFRRPLYLLIYIC